MISIKFVQPNGDEKTVAAVPGRSLMEVARSAGIVGIEADCGGACACGTCQVYVDEAWAAALEPPAPIEEATLEFVVERRSGSRLSCQMQVIEGHDGLILHVPVSQYW